MRRVLKHQKLARKADWDRQLDQMRRHQINQVHTVQLTQAPSHNYPIAKIHTSLYTSNNTLHTECSPLKDLK